MNQTTADVLDQACEKTREALDQIEKYRQQLLAANPARLTTRQVDDLFKSAARGLAALHGGGLKMLHALQYMRKTADEIDDVTMLIGNPVCLHCHGYFISPSGQTCPCVAVQAGPIRESSTEILDP